MHEVALNISADTVDDERLQEILAKLSATLYEELSKDHGSVDVQVACSTCEKRHIEGAVGALKVQPPGTIIAVDKRYTIMAVALPKEPVVVL